MGNKNTIEDVCVNHLGWKKYIFAIFSSVFSFLQVMGSKIHLFQKPYFDTFGALDCLKIVVIAILIFLVSSVLYMWMEKYFYRKMIDGEATVRRTYKGRCWLLSGLILISWLPWFLVFCPGGVSVDTLNSVRQAAGILPIINDNPVLHTISLIPFIKIGFEVNNMNIGIALYTIVQMLVLAIVFGFCIDVIISRINRKVVKVLVVLFYTCNPVIAMFAITIIKDSSFSVFVFAFMIVLLRIVESKDYLNSRIGNTIFVLTIILVAFSRVNGFLLIAAGLIPLALSLFRKRRPVWKVLLPLILSGTILYGPLYDAIGISTPRATTEALGVPLQQICYAVVTDGEIAKSDMEYIENNIMCKEAIIASFTPHTVDGIKFAKEYKISAVNNSKWDFIRTWLNVMKTNKGAYLKAWLMETKGYYFIDYTRLPCTFFIEENEFNIHSEGLIDKLTGIPIQQYLSWFQTRIARLCSIGAMMTIIWFCVCCIIANKKYSSLIVCSPIIGLWISLMIGTPIYGEFRYIYPAFLAMPLIILLAKESFQRESI